MHGRLSCEAEETRKQSDGSSIDVRNGEIRVCLAHRRQSRGFTSRGESEL